MNTRAPFGLIAICMVTFPGCGGDSPADPAPTADASPAAADAAPGGDPLVGIGELSAVASGFSFIEGPVWHATDGVLLFSDLFGNKIHQLNADGTTSEFRSQSNRSNGLAFDRQGRLLTAEFTTRQLSRTEDNGDLVMIAGMFEGKRLNETNDITVSADGTIYFTDPSFAGIQRELDFNGVFRVAPDGELFAEWKGPTSSQPNGIGLSPDGSVVYVADTPTSSVYRFAVNSDGSLEQQDALTTEVPGPDGLTVGAFGNIFVASSDGIRAYAPDGSLWGTISVPKQPSNCAFGGPDGRTLYITARDTLYRVSFPAR